MKTSLLLALLAFVFTGCAASLHSQVYNDIHVGDQKSEVIAKLGEPDTFDPTSVSYKKKADVCKIAFEDEKVTGTYCEKDPNHISVGAAFFKGFADGYNRSRQQQPVSCHSTSDYAGGYNTTCN